MVKQSPLPGARRGQTGGRRQRALPSRPAANRDDDIPGIYREMLSESQSASEVSPYADNPPHKRRRVGERGENKVVECARAFQQNGESTFTIPPQTVYDLDASDEESEPEWEDVELPESPAPPGLPSMLPAGSEGDQKPLQITLGNDEHVGKSNAAIRRKPITGVEKKLRLDIHKLHVVCLLAHVRLRNSWCNDHETQKTMSRLLSKHTVMCLNPKEDLPQFTRSTTFADGLVQAAETFRRKFKVIGHGIRRPYWLEDISGSHNPTEFQDDIEILQTKSDFHKHAGMMQGSKDFGAQLFCAMLRGIGVDTRLICSLQVLPFTGVAKVESPRKRTREYIVISEDDIASSGIDSTVQNATPDAVPHRRLGRPGFPSTHTRSSTPPIRKDIYLSNSDSSFPVFWVEAFNHAMQKWVCIDPFVANTVGKSPRFEPPASDKYNNMNYVIAFNEDGFSRDVTRRYTKSFNSKTRKLRVEYTREGERWWKHTMQALESPFPEDRDQLELGELAAKAASEGMPKSVQDFKGHPVYALERHLRWNEVIHPKREIGKVGLSKLSLNKKSPPLEPVYRRADVHSVKSADGWYRQGRNVKPGEQPLKRIKARSQHQSETLNSDDDEKPETALYAAYQTELYVPEPVVDGHIPRNEYGNIDVYIPSMVPSGGFHLRHPDAVQAAKLLSIDYADAVTGFKFKRRHGTAIINGIVAAVDYKDALEAVIAGINDERAAAESIRRTVAALRMWKLFLIKLRVLERVNSYRVEGDDFAASDDVDECEANDLGGGFLPEDGPPALPTGGIAMEAEVDGPQYSSITRNPHGNSGGGFVAETDTQQTPSQSTPRSLPRNEKADPSASQSRYTLVIVPKVGPDVRGDDQTGLLTQAVRPSGTGRESSLPTNGTRESPVIVGSPERELSGLPELIHFDSDSEIDRSSMISHDPEDDDAEPEWLLSD